MRVETHFPVGVANIKTDPSQPESALLNLIVNARDAVLLGGVVAISAREASVAADEDAALSAGRCAFVSVTDTGEGVDTETVASAIDLFFTNKGVGKGVGLGVSMVQGLIEQSGGALRMFRRPDQGSTVELWLPAATMAGPQTAVSAAATPEPSRRWSCSWWTTKTSR